MRILSIAIILITYTSSLLSQDSEYLKEELLKVNFQPNSIDINKENTQLLIGGENKMVVLYNLESKKEEFEIEAHYQAVVKVCFSNIYDGFYTVGDKSFKLWLFGNDQPEKLFKGSHTFITDLDITAKEDYFVGGSYEKRFRYWKNTAIETPTEINTSQKKSVVSVAISKDGKKIAAGSLDSTIELWDTDSLRRTVKILAHSAPVCCLKFINNGKYLLSASHDGYIKLWDVATGNNIKVYKPHAQPISEIDVSPDEKLVLTASYDNTIGLYNIASGDCIYQYHAHEVPVLDVQWNSKGDGFYSCDNEGNIYQWNVPKKVFVDFYFGKEMNDEINRNRLFSPRRKGESKDDYKTREERAEKFKNTLIDKYYKQYTELDKTQKVQL